MASGIARSRRGAIARPHDVHWPHVPASSRASDHVTVPAKLSSGSNFHAVGADLKPGDSILNRGTELGAAEIGIAAATNRADLPVFRRPRVAVMSTGDELFEVGKEGRRGQIPDSNRWALLAALREAGAEVEVLGIAPDEAERCVLGEIGDSSLFGARFRMNAARALLLPRGNPRRRMPLWLQRLKAQDLLQTVREFPSFNASVVDEAIALKPRVHMGIAVALADTDELIVPVVRDADTLSIEGLARAIADLAARARERKLRPEDVQGGTITLTNPGVFGGITGTPILNQPQVAIVGLGAIVKRAVVLEGEDGDRIAARPTMTVALTFDHRAADGMAAFKFLAGFKARIEGRDSC